MKIGFINKLRILTGQLDPGVLIENWQRDNLANDVNDRDLAKQVSSGRIKSAPAASAEPDIPDSISNYFSEHQPVSPGFQFEVIEEIRCLALNNGSVSQALNNIVSLANTGHTLKFDDGVSAEDVIKMRKHINDHVQTWHYGIADGNALASKFFYQAFITGAVCEEVILDDNLKGVKRVTLPRPETIRFVYNRSESSYEPYQQRKNFINYRGYDPANGLIKLNKASFRYYTLATDLEVPYGYPPYLPAIPSLKDQKLMLANINFIIQQMGIVGFLELLVDKPEQNDGESDAMYKRRLGDYIQTCKNNIQSSMREGIVVGYREDHEFQFHSATKNASGVSDLFKQNELMVHSGLKQDPMLSGKQTGSGEGYITVIFTKLISELKNVQSIVSKVLKHIYELELRLAGYNFKNFEVVFNASTIQDDLKSQQALEIKIRNASKLWMEGVISKDKYAQMVGEEKSFNQKTPKQVTQEQQKVSDSSGDAKKKQDREEDKDASDRRVREKNKPGSATKQNTHED